MDLESRVPATRRRGEELEAALLDAAWAELEANGYGGLTFDAVAERAHTSRPVIYRRWPDRDALVLAAISHRIAKRDTTLPDTGTLRGDLIALMTAATIRGKELVVLMTVLFGGYYSATGQTIAQIRERIVDTRSPAMDRLLARARARGERVPTDPPVRVKTLLGDLLRHEMLMSLTPPDRDYITSVVDDVVMPLLDHYADVEERARNS